MRLSPLAWRFPFIAALIVLPLAAQIGVRIMPGFPNAPHQSPLERTAVRPGAAFLVWGNVGGGTGAANGYTYTFSFSANPNVMVNDDGSLTGNITDDSFIFEEVSFTLLGGSTREFIDCTLTVDDGMGGTGSRWVGLVIIDPTDPLSDTELEALAIDVNIAIQDGLRWLYVNQEPAGSWSTATIDGQHRCAGTSFVVWAFQNQGHVPGNDPSEDIYADTVQAGLDYIFDQASVSSNISAPNGPMGISDLNGDGMTVNLCPGGRAGYASPIAAAAIIASSAPGRVVNVPSSQVNGWTYQTVIENFIDWSGQTQNTSNGGWNYNPSNGQSRSDMSINSWHYVAMEGAQTVFMLDVPDWIIINGENTLVSHQSTSDGAFGYTGTGQCLGGSLNRMATTGGGLSGLALVETEDPPQATIIATAPAPLNTVANKRQEALDFLGDSWGHGPPGNYCQGHKGNYYGMWTIARALRLTADAVGVPKVDLQNGGVTFDWETGEENMSGMLAGPNTTREGYFPWLLRNQETTGSPQSRGRWQDNTYVGTTMETAMAVLILTPRVFLLPNTPPSIAVTVGGQPQACPVVIPASESVNITFDLTVTDPDPGDIITLSATGVPAGATHMPGLPAMGGSPLNVSFSWTPTPAQVGTHLITYTAVDQAGEMSTCTVEIQVGTCQLLIGVQPESAPIQPNVTLYVQPMFLFPVTMQQVPVFNISDPSLTGTTVYCQVFMDNPFVFPNNPVQSSPCVRLRIGMDTRVFGTGDIDIWPVGTAKGPTFSIGFDVF